MEPDFITDLVNIDRPKCGCCETNPSSELHTCPYQEDINGDSEYQCDCCTECEKNCADDI